MLDLATDGPGLDEFILIARLSMEVLNRAILDILSGSKGFCSRLKKDKCCTCKASRTCTYQNCSLSWLIGHNGPDKKYRSDAKISFDRICEAYGVDKRKCINLVKWALKNNIKIQTKANAYPKLRAIKMIHEGLAVEKIHQLTGIPIGSIRMYAKKYKIDLPRECPDYLSIKESSRGLANVLNGREWNIKPRWGSQL